MRNSSRRKTEPHGVPVPGLEEVLLRADRLAANPEVQEDSVLSWPADVRHPLLSRFDALDLAAIPFS
jgi:hypothetical protein